MRVCIDIEANGLLNPTEIWVIVCKDVDTKKTYIFRKVTRDVEEKERFLNFAGGVSTWIGHNLLGYDYPVLKRLVGLDIPSPHTSCCDTLILSKLIDYSRDGHSIENYGLEFGIPKVDFSDWAKYSQEMEDYCVRDVDICHRIFTKYAKYFYNSERTRSIQMEHQFQLDVVNDLENNGFYFDRAMCGTRLARVSSDLEKLDEQILKAFPPRQVLVREFTPKATKFGTISKTSVPRQLWDRIHEYEVGKTYPLYKFEEFNPASHKQIIQVLNEAKWEPVDKTTTHINTERELNRLKYQKSKDSSVDIALKELYSKLEELRKTGWKVNETNLGTLPESAPAPARLLAKRILLESRRRTLTEWSSLVKEDGRIHGRFYGIGAWTHRMAHQNPNTANIPSEFSLDGSPKLLGKEMRQLWRAPKNRLLVGVDAEGIQLRIFAHYINDPEFTKSLVEGKKDDKTDPHSLNQKILGGACKSRAAAKRFIYALLLGAGLQKLSSILDASISETEEALDRLMERYTGFRALKEDVIPQDARRGYFIGLDGRAVRIPGSELGMRRHLAMSGYLQNGEAVVMKMAACKWAASLHTLDAKLVNFVHDEWQTECPNDVSIALKIAKMQADSIRDVGEELNLNCPLAGSYWNEDHKDYTIGVNWYQTH